MLKLLLFLRFRRTVRNGSGDFPGTVRNGSCDLQTQELFGTIWNGSGTVPDSKPIARGTVRNGSGDLHNIAILLTYIVVYF